MTPEEKRRQEEADFKSYPISQGLVESLDGDDVGFASWAVNDPRHSLDAQALMKAVVTRMNERGYDCTLFEQNELDSKQLIQIDIMFCKRS